MIKTYNIFYVIIRIIILFPCGLNGSKYFPRKARVGAQRRSFFQEDAENMQTSKQFL